VPTPLRANTYDMRPLTVTPLHSYEHALLGSDGFVYVEAANEPQPIYSEDRIPDWTLALIEEHLNTEIHVYEVHFDRLEIDYDRGVAEMNGRHGVWFYEWSLSGNHMGEESSLKRLMETIYSEIVPPGSDVYLVGEDKPYTLERWKSRNFRYTGIDAVLPEHVYVNGFDDHVFDWERTLDALARKEEAA